MNLKLPLFIFIFSFVFYSSFSQTLSNKVIANGGSFSSASWGSLSATIGEAVITTLPSANLTLLQGFQQPTSGLAGIYSHVQPLKAIIYPNPATTALTLEITLPIASNITYKIFDVNGKQLNNDVFSVDASHPTLKTIDVNDLCNGFYLLTLNDDSGIFQNFKIQINR